MKVIAITGRSGSGKSTVSAHYAALGWPVLDADETARAVTQPGTACLKALAQTFGSDILAADGSLQRNVLAARAFASEKTTQTLVSITHPAIIARLLAGVEAARSTGRPFVFVDGAVIIGEPFERYCDAFIVVTVPRRVAVSRIMARDGISKQAAENRLAAQRPERELCARADYVIRNDSTQKALLQQADDTLQHLLERQWI